MNKTTEIALEMAREAKAKQPDLMEKTRAAVVICNACNYDDELKTYAFLSLFHPELTHAQKRDICRDERKTNQ